MYALFAGWQAATTVSVMVKADAETNRASSVRTKADNSNAVTGATTRAAIGRMTAIATGGATTAIRISRCRRPSLRTLARLRIEAATATTSTWTSIRRRFPIRWNRLSTSASCKTRAALRVDEGFAMAVVDSALVAVR